MKTLATIERAAWVQHGDGSVTARGVRMRVDTDGKGSHHGDKTAQNHTTYRPDLDADVDFFGVVPGIVRQKGDGVFIGCQMRVEDTVTGRAHDLVCGDVGPNKRSGEFSRAVVLFFGFNGDPNRGGCDEPRFNVTLWPGKPAVVAGKQYHLQAA